MIFVVHGSIETTPLGAQKIKRVQVQRVIHFLILVIKTIYYHVCKWWELRKSSAKGYCLDVTANSQHLNQKERRAEGVEN